MQVATLRCARICNERLRVENHTIAAWLGAPPDRRRQYLLSQLLPDGDTSFGFG
jgi:hypothetical protein